MSRFTQGKWTVKELLAGWGVFAERNGFRDREPVADCLDNEANARLIAAAPELYELIREELIPTSDYGGLISFARESKIKAVLARIDGEETRA